MFLFFVTIAVLMLAASAACAGPVLWDFETEEDVAAWRLRNAQQDSLERADRYATAGAFSMRFATPAWREGMEQWPAFEAAPPVTDWRPYDRLMVDIVNPGTDQPFLSVFISDGRVPFREGLSYRLNIPTRGYERFLIPLRFPEAVDASDISIVHFFTQRPDNDMEIYLDNMTLLAPGEEPPAPRPGLGRDLADLLTEQLDLHVEFAAQAQQALGEMGLSPAAVESARAELARLMDEVAAVRGRLDAPDITLAQLASRRAELEALARQANRMPHVLRFQASFDALGHGESPVLVGFASSMEKILPREMPFELAVAEGVEISLARNEVEAFQVAVMPRGEALTAVTVTVGDLRSEAGDVFSADNIDCDVVGYVETKSAPPYSVSHVGWWPDPLLDFLGPVDIARGDLQTFWVRLRAPRDQPPGVYRGTLTVSAQGAAPVAFDLTARVYDFTMPDHSPLPTAISFWRAPAMGSDELWETLKYEYADFLADHYIDYDSLYRREAPDWDIITHLHEQGRLVAFNLGNVFNAGVSEEGFEQALAETIERLRPAYERAKELDLLGYAYIYGFDERPPEQFGMLERTAAALKREFPEVLLMTTSYDHSFGLHSEVKSIDAWCPLTPRFNEEFAEEARAEGRYVWWYICCGPHNPFANWFVEYAAIESRLLMGAMTARFRPDGFLYYATTIWNQNRPIESGPFTEWDPVSWTVYHGDGSLFCAGPGGRPLPTIRLENYRDGMEDFAYAVMLEEAIRRQEARGDALTAGEREWLAEARAALPVPESLVESMARYSREPRDLYAWRNRVGELLDRSGVTDADPWGERFGVRGLRR